METKSSSGERRKEREREGEQNGGKRGREVPHGSSGIGLGFNPCLSCLEAIVALSQTYQLSHQLDLIRTFHTSHTHTHTCGLTHANASEV